MQLYAHLVVALMATPLMLITTNTTAASDWDVRGNVGLQLQAFIEDAVHAGDQRSNLSIAGEAELFRTLGDAGSITITPFLRLDQSDSERSHLDLRELLYNHAGDTWEVNIGLGKVFWGVAESVNVVDVINQSDAVEGVDSSDKLGQPMINLLLTRDWGDIDLYVLPGFRQRTFAGRDGRPRIPAQIDSDAARYESSAEQSHIDLAVRYTRTLGDWDLGVHAFDGTARDPLFQFDPVSSSLVPLYYQATQVGIDAQATLESWLLKVESIYRTGELIDNHAEVVAGVEYSFYGVAESDADVGVVSEWLYDDRGDEAGQPFQNDLLMGLRFALNDEQSTEALLGAVVDLDGGGQLLSLEASRRIGSDFRISADAYLWTNTQQDALLDGFRDEDFVQLELTYFF